MGKYLLKRLGQSIIAILGITVVVFFILHLTGNPVELMVSPTTSKEEMEILSEEMGFNDPLPVQYVRFLKGALVGDFGTSYYYNEPAMSVVLGIPAGIVAAVKRNSVSDAVIRVLALLGQCMPAFWLGIMLIMLFAVKLGWMPTGGAEDGLRSLILPAFTLLALFIAAVLGSSLGNVILIAGITSWVRYARLVRGEILGIKEMEYIEAIRAAGGTDARIIFKHILPNIISPVIVIATLEMAKIVLIEASLSFLGYGVPITIPTWGRMLSEARDNILTDPWQCIFPGLCITLTVLGVNLLGDWLRDYLDPKLDV